MKIAFDERTSALLTRATSLFISVSSITMLVVGGLAFVNTARAKSAEIGIARLNKDLDGARKSLAEARRVTQAGQRIEGPSGRPIVDSFQAAVEEKAREYGCSVECRVGEPALYISRFLNEPDKSLQQVELTMVLRGPLDQVMRTLASFKTFNIPFEFGDLNIQRSTEANALEQVTANLITAVLIPSQEGGTP